MKHWKKFRSGAGGSGGLAVLANLTLCRALVQGTCNKRKKGSPKCSVRQTRFQQAGTPRSSLRRFRLMNRALICLQNTPVKSMRPTARDEDDRPTRIGLSQVLADGGMGLDFSRPALCPGDTRSQDVLQPNAGMFIDFFAAGLPKYRPWETHRRRRVFGCWHPCSLPGPSRYASC
jgi:hypothetical protein